ncbi:MAG TPA: hypothetical protein VGE26_09205 [Sphingobacteriaceae bacterium]
MTPLEKSLILSYVHNKLAIKNLETTVHELKMVKNPSAGRMQFVFEKLIAANKKAYTILEKNMKHMGDLQLIENDIEAVMSELWSAPITTTNE